MIHEIKNCPLVAITKSNTVILLTRDVKVKGIIMPELTLESRMRIVAEFLQQNIEIDSVSIDMAEFACVEVGVL